MHSSLGVTERAQIPLPVNKICASTSHTEIWKMYSHRPLPKELSCVAGFKIDLKARA